MMAGLVEPDCKPEGLEESVVLAARGTCILSSIRGLSFSCASMQGTSKDCNVVGRWASVGIAAVVNVWIDCNPCFNVLGQVGKVQTG